MNVIQLEETVPHEYEMNMIYESFSIDSVDSETEDGADPGRKLCRMDYRQVSVPPAPMLSCHL